MELWRKKVQERCEKCAGTIRKSEKKTQNLPHCGSASGNSGRLCVLFWRFWQRARRDGRNAGERRARCTGRMLWVLYSSNTTKIDTSMPYSENMSKTEDWGRNLTAGVSGGSVYGCQ